MTTVRLDECQRAILRGFRALDPKGEYQYNTWNPQLGDVMRSNGVSGYWERELPSLVRRGLLVAEGRGRFRQYGITDAGLAAVE